MQNLREKFLRMSLEELITEEEELASRMLQTKGHLDDARARFHATGEYSDPKWYASAVTAARVQGRLHQTLQRVISEKRAELRKQEQETKDNTAERCFIKVAKATLPTEQYQAIWDAVHELRR